jgi:hypothetical protein
MAQSKEPTLHTCPCMGRHGQAIAFDTEDRAVTSRRKHSCLSFRPSEPGLPGEGEPESSNHSRSCLHSSRGLLGPGSREPG